MTTTFDLWRLERIAQEGLTYIWEGVIGRPPYEVVDVQAAIEDLDLGFEISEQVADALRLVWRFARDPEDWALLLALADWNQATIGSDDVIPRLAGAWSSVAFLA